MPRQRRKQTGGLPDNLRHFSVEGDAIQEHLGSDSENAFGKEKRQTQQKETRM
jgi:hypothetical protein